MTALVAKGLTKRFGGLTAVNDVSLTLEIGSIHAVIGPNGAGKSTLTNLLSGDLLPTSGSIHLGEHDVTRKRPAARSHRGLGRSYQRTNVFPTLTALENCRLAAQSRRASPLRWFSGAQSPGLLEVARHSLHRVGLEARADIAAGTLSHGEQRQLEIAMALATAPRVLLLDEPLAGTGAEEARRIVDLLKDLSREHAILLIEHDMDAVFALASVLTVMVDGRVICSGSPEMVRNDAQVRQAYLGGEAH